MTQNAEPTIIDENVKNEINAILDEIKAEIASSDGKWWMGYDAMIKESEVFRIIDKCRL